MEEVIRLQKMTLANQEIVKPSTVWLMFMFLGWSYGSLGKGFAQFFFYITCGGLGVWTLIRFFTLSSSIRQYNNSVYIKHGLNDLITI